MNFFVSHVIDLMKFEMVDKTVVKNICIEFLSMLENKPHTTIKLCWFFQAAAQYDVRNRIFITRKLIEFLRDKKKNLYEWQEIILFDRTSTLKNVPLAIRVWAYNKHSKQGGGDEEDEVFRGSDYRYFEGS